MKKLNFTLIEITVAFGVLAILIMFLMQFLSTAQTSWTFAEKRARAYADSRTALDFIERGLKSIDRTKNSGITDGTELKYTGVIPYGKGEYKKDIEIKIVKTNDTDLEKAEWTLTFNGENFIENVTYFYVKKIGSNSYAVRLDLFGSEEDFREWKMLSSDTDAQKNYKSQHGFTFVRLINLQ